MNNGKELCERMKACVASGDTAEIESLRQQLAASQVREAKLREALDDAKYAYLTGEIRLGSTQDAKIMKEAA